MLNEIRTQLDGLISRGDRVNGETVKTALCAACRDFDPDLSLYATGVDDGGANGGEWLYDVTALQYDDDDFLTRTALTAECEWGTQDEIFYDFEKLLLSRAILRVMVFDGTRQPGYDELFRIFAQYIGRYSHTAAGDAWLFAAWTVERFVYHRISAFNDQETLE